MKVKELVKALMRCGLTNGTSLGYHSGLYEQAASALESMQEELDRVKAERDAAVEDLKKAIFDDCTNFCTFCAHQNPKLEAPYCLAYFCENDEWQWRGLEGRIPHE